MAVVNPTWRTIGDRPPVVFWAFLWNWVRVRPTEMACDMRRRLTLAVTEEYVLALLEPSRSGASRKLNRRPAVIVLKTLLLPASEYAAPTDCYEN